MQLCFKVKAGEDIIHFQSHFSSSPQPGDFLRGAMLTNLQANLPVHNLAARSS